MMRLAVCIPTYNQAPYLRLAVESALAQRECEVEVWVGDDASTDATPGVMAEFGDHPRVRYHRHPTNLGVAANASWLMGRPETEFIVRLDSDDLLGPDYGHMLAALLRTHPRAGIAHAAVQEIDGRGAPRRQRLLRRSIRCQAADEALREAITGYRVAANICMFRRAALPAFPCFRSGTDFVEDWDLFVRLSAQGWDNIYCDQILSSYRVAVSGAPAPKPGRKLKELAGVRRIFEDSLQPAFQARGWSTLPITKARRSLACGQARVLGRVPVTSADRARMKELLEQIGNGPGLRWRLLLVSIGLTGLLDLAAAFQLRARDVAKQILRLGQRMRRRG